MSTDLQTHELAEARVERGFWIHLGIYALVNAGLAALNFSRNADRPWVLWVIGGWGVGVLIHAAAVFMLPNAHERMVARTEARIERRREREMR